jgi:hypothetical protein
MAVLLYTKDFQSLTGGAVAPLEHHSKSVNVDELASGDLKDPKRRGAVPEGEHTKLDLCIQSLKSLDRGLILGDLKVIKTLGDALLQVQRANFVVDKGGHLILCLVRVSDNDSDKVDHVHAHNSSAGWYTSLVEGVLTVCPVIEIGP